MTRALPTLLNRPEHPSDPRAIGGLGRALLLTGALAMSVPAWAHGEAGDVLPPEPGWDAAAALALRGLDVGGDLPSTAMAGYLLQGDAGDPPERQSLEHASTSLAWRATPSLGAYVQLAAHGSEPPEWEDAWVQWRRDTAEGDAWWWSLGRMAPAQGEALAQAGVFDDFALPPLAQRMAWDHAMPEHGLQWSWRGERAQADWALDLGVWSGDAFPGHGAASPVPSLHLGWRRGPWRADGFWLAQRARDRGASVLGVAGHSHVAPTCDAALQEVVCFTGRSDVQGLSLVWDGVNADRAWPLRVTWAGWRRLERGGLRSQNGAVDYQGDGRGWWLEGAWSWRTDWRLSARIERLSQRLSLSGQGSGLVAEDAGFTEDSAMRRESLSLAYQWRPWSRWVLTWGQEAQGQQAGVTFAALRWVLQWP